MTSIGSRLGLGSGLLSEGVFFDILPLSLLQWLSQESILRDRGNGPQQ